MVAFGNPRESETISRDDAITCIVIVGSPFNFTGDEQTLAAAPTGSRVSLARVQANRFSD